MRAAIDSSMLRFQSNRKCKKESFDRAAADSSYIFSIVKPMDRENFNRLQQASQRRMFAFILTLVPHHADAEEVLQEANLVMWKKRDQFEPGTDFIRWANRIAYLEAMAYIRRRRRRHWLCFGSELSENMAEFAFDVSNSLDERIDLLQGCLKMLPDKDRDLIQKRYLNDSPVKAVADALGRSADAVYKALTRIRITLYGCIERKRKKLEE